MPSFDLSALRAGDIVIFEWLGSGWHTALCSGNGKIVHCVNEQTGTTEDALTNHTASANAIHGFRAKWKAADPGAVVATAQGWIQTVAKGPSLPGYDSARGSAVLSRYGFDQKQHTDGPPFRYDALYRAVKWAARIGGAFTNTRGTTCCAFVMAAWQATLLRLAMESADYDKKFFPRCHEYLREHRYMKGKPKKQPDNLKERSRIGVSNVGPVESLRKPFEGDEKDKPDWKTLEERGIEDIWEIVLTELGADWVLDEIEGARGKWLQLVLSKPLFCDAKFTYSNTLFERLCADAGAWERIVVPKSKA